MAYELRCGLHRMHRGRRRDQILEQGRGKEGGVVGDEFVVGAGEIGKIDARYPEGGENGYLQASLRRQSRYLNRCLDAFDDVLQAECRRVPDRTVYRRHKMRGGTKRLRRIG